MSRFMTTYLLRHCDYSIELHNIDVAKLAHDGRLLQELGLDAFIGASSADLHCHLHGLYVVLLPH